MRWPWRHRDEVEDRRAQRATAATEQVLREECDRLDEATELAKRLVRHRERNRFAEAMRIALGGRP